VKLSDDGTYVCLLIESDNLMFACITKALTNSDFTFTATVLDVNSANYDITSFYI
jgi:hypothetical protein